MLHVSKLTGSYLLQIYEEKNKTSPFKSIDIQGDHSLLNIINMEAIKLSCREKFRVSFSCFHKNVSDMNI